MFCPHCGNSIADNTKFCPFCGASTGASDAAAPQTNPTTSYTDPYAPQNTTNTPPQPSTPPSYMPNFNAAGLAKTPKAKYTNVVAIAGTVVFFISIFLPFLSIEASSYFSTYSISVSLSDLISLVGVDFAVVMMFLCMAAIIVLQCVKAPQTYTIVLAAISLVLLLAEIGAVESSPDVAASVENLSYSFGFWLMLLAHIVILVSGPIHKAIVKK